MTSLDMAGLSLTLTFLDAELERNWTAPADTPAFRRGAVAGVRTGQAPLPEAAGSRATTAGADPQQAATHVRDAHGAVGVAGGAESQQAATHALAAFDAVAAVLTAQESHLGALDAVAGDGDHGQGMVLGVRGATTTALVQDEADDLPGGQPCQVQTCFPLAGGQEQSGRGQISHDAARGQPPLSYQVAAVLLDQPLSLGAGHPHCRDRDHTEPAEVDQQRHHPSLGQLQGVAGRTPRLQELLHPGRRQPLWLELLAGQPPADVGHQVHLARCPRRPVSLPGELLAEPGRVWGQRACHPCPRRISHDAPPSPGSIPVKEASVNPLGLC